MHSSQSHSKSNKFSLPVLFSYDFAVFSISSSIEFIQMARFNVSCKWVLWSLANVSETVQVHLLRTTICLTHIYLRLQNRIRLPVPARPIVLLGFFSTVFETMLRCLKQPRRQQTKRTMSQASGGLLFIPGYFQSWRSRDSQGHFNTDWEDYSLRKTNWNEECR